jgi:hypothetical protein
MAVNHFDQASRYLAKLDPPSFLHWLLATEALRYSFSRWLDTRPIPFPGQADRVCDTVAELLDRMDPSLIWAFVIEFQTKPDAHMFGRLLEYLGRLWREKLADYPNRRCQVAAAVINLTGKGESSHHMQFGSLASTQLHVVEINLAELEVETLLSAMENGTIGKVCLPWIPLLQGSQKPDIMDRWRTLAAQEPDTQKRGIYAGLATIFADLTGEREQWQHALEGWNLEQSTLVLEWEAKAEQRGLQRGLQRGRAEGKVEDLLHLLEKRFGKKVPAALATKIQQTTDLDQLNTWFDAAITIGSLQEFRQLVKKAAS